MIIFDIETEPLPNLVIPELDPASIEGLATGEFDPSMVKIGNTKNPVLINEKIERARIDFEARRRIFSQLDIVAGSFADTGHRLLLTEQIDRENPCRLTRERFAIGVLGSIRAAHPGKEITCGSRDIWFRPALHDPALLDHWRTSSRQCFCTRTFPLHLCRFVGALANVFPLAIRACQLRVPRTSFRNTWKERKERRGFLQAVEI